MEATACNLPLCGIHHLSSILMEAQAGKSMDLVKLPQSLKSSSFRLRWGGSSKLELKSRSSIRVLASSSNSVYESSASSKIEKDDDGGPVCPPGYRPTPANRELRTPHSGYHFDGSTRKFFEGWYFKVSIPQKRQSFCFMYSIESPAFPKKLTTPEIAQHGPRFTGVGAQILGAYDKYICQYSEESQNFWGRKWLSIWGGS